MELYTQSNALKEKKPGLKTYLAMGGWAAGGEVFSNMARFPGMRKAFIQTTLEVMDIYGFDDIDIDWEYPAAEDRGDNTQCPPVYN